MISRIAFKLGERVRLTDSPSLVGRVVAHVRRSNGGESWIVEYWAGDKREEVQCDREELESME